MLASINIIQELIMRIKDKIYLDSEGLRKEGPITIVAFGDSVTHGAVALDEIDYESVYWNRLRNKILGIRNYVPVNVINAGIGGVTATGSLDRIDSQVLIHKPDLVIVCFGLNDINGTIDEYLSSLKIIFEKCKKGGSDVIFMTPNMLNTYVAEDTPEKFLDYAAVTAEFQNSGKMDTYIYAAVNVAKEMDVIVCDCYSKWKKLSETQDTTQLLANRINHPIREMHQLFADSLFDIIFDEIPCCEATMNTMYSRVKR